MTLMQTDGTSSMSAGGVISRSIGAFYASAICALFIVGSQPVQATTSTYSVEVPAEQTDSHLRAPAYAAPALSTGEAVLEIRRRSGLTWEELSDLFGVSRRSVHNWASGEVLAAKNERHVRLVFGAVRQVDRGESRKTRDTLLMADDQGVSPMTLLKAGDIAGAIARAGSGPQIIEAREPMAATAKETRSRPRATAYLDAMDAPPVASSGKGRAVRVYRTPKV